MMTNDTGGPRVGVFICSCGGQISLSADIKAAGVRAGSIAGVAAVRSEEYLCSKDAMERMARTIREEKLDSVVAAACSPRIYMREFQDTIVSAGLNECMIEMANIREQGSWMHIGDGIDDKVQDTISMAVAKVRLQKPSEKGNVSHVNKARCTGCGVCESVCNINAVRIVSDPEYGGKKKAAVDSKACEGCGACVSACPTSAMDQTCFSNAQIVAEMSAALENKDERGRFPHIVVFACHWCSYAAADEAGLKRLTMDPHFRVIRTMCSARVDPEWVLKALGSGADGILVLAGQPGRCHYEVGNLRTRKRMVLLQTMLQQLGFDADRFQIEYVDSDQPEKFRRSLEEYVAKVRELGPNPVMHGGRPDPVRHEIPTLNL
jgi:coenzyme F420-reducing hydrogenase delta subunit/Pyruvate/2-oxoacid:ferredoxin oxidoreductase delta subunit